MENRQAFVLLVSSSSLNLHAEVEEPPRVGIRYAGISSSSGTSSSSPSLGRVWALLLTAASSSSSLDRSTVTAPAARSHILHILQQYQPSYRVLPLGTTSQRRYQRNAHSSRYLPARPGGLTGRTPSLTRCHRSQSILAIYCFLLVNTTSQEIPTSHPYLG